VLTQWFERARLEKHPNKPDQYKVLLGLLATEVCNHIPGLKTNCESSVVNELCHHHEEAPTSNNQITLREALGCPQFMVSNVPAAVQSFERGMMI